MWKSITLYANVVVMNGGTFKVLLKICEKYSNLNMQSLRSIHACLEWWITVVSNSILDIWKEHLKIEFHVTYLLVIKNVGLIIYFETHSLIQIDKKLLLNLLYIKHTMQSLISSRYFFTR